MNVYLEKKKSISGRVHFQTAQGILIESRGTHVTGGLAASWSELLGQPSPTPRPAGTTERGSADGCLSCCVGEQVVLRLVRAARTSRPFGCRSNFSALRRRARRVCTAATSA